MTSTAQNFSLYAGTRVTVQITVSDADGSGVDDLTSNYTLLVWALAPYEQGSTTAFRRTPVLQKKSTTSQVSTGGNEIDIAGSSNERADVQLILGDTDDLEGTYHHQLEGFDASGNGVVLSEGTVTILPNINNP
jgi:hypothetical protein